MHPKHQIPRPWRERTNTRSDRRVNRREPAGSYHEVRSLVEVVLVADKEDRSNSSLERILMETDEFLKDYDQTYGKPPPLTPEERERLDAEIRNYLRRGHHSK